MPCLAGKESPGVHPFVAELWRFPVKSLRGERLDVAELGPGGVVGDRMVHLRDGEGRVLTARSRRGLLGLSGTIGDDGEVMIDGRPWDSDSARERVRRVAGVDATAVAFAGPDDGQRHDVLPLTVLSDGMARAVGAEPRRFRANLVVGGAPWPTERAWIGRGLQIGEALIGVRNARTRCVMTTFDPDTLERNPAVLRRIVQEFNGRVALDCWVIAPGVVQVGQPVETVDLPDGLEPPLGNGGRHASLRSAVASP